MYSWDNAQVVLVGNKTDLEEERVISTERGRRLAEQLGSYQSPLYSMCFYILTVVVIDIFIIFVVVCSRLIYLFLYMVRRPLMYNSHSRV